MFPSLALLNGNAHSIEQILNHRKKTNRKKTCKFESSQKDESRWQSTDSSKAYRNTSAFKCSLNCSHSHRQGGLPILNLADFNYF